VHIDELEQNKKRRFRIVVYFYMISVLLILTVTSTYAWFSLTKTPRVSNMAIYINSPTGMEISLRANGSEWGQHLSYLDMVSETAPLRPVTWSEKDQKFYSANYDAYGRRTNNWTPLSDDIHSNREDYVGYYCMGTFYARTDSKVKVSLAPAVAVADGTGGSGTFLMGEPVWDAEKIVHSNGGEGAENAMRIGIKITRLDQYEIPTDNTEFYIYEPNSNTHYDGSFGYEKTPSIDGADTLVPDERIIKQTSTTWKDVEPVEKGTLSCSFGEFTTGTELFEMEKGEKVMIQLYIWLEGQDMDCNNSMKDAKILTNIQFAATTIPTSGME
jgi:hypothetical protein